MLRDLRPGPRRHDRETRLLAISGAGGRLGRALVSAAGGSALDWSRPHFDLDDVGGIVQLVKEARPRLVIHPAAMTDVDACAREPEVAMQRNGHAVGALAEACRSVAAGLVLISTNEVFSGERDDGHGYVETDEPRPGNAYGTSKLLGERLATDVFGRAEGLWIVRTCWLFGPPGKDFPDKITLAADRLPPGDALPVVADEYGSPTYTIDLAAAILLLVASSRGGIFHLAGEGVASRLEWAQEVLAARRPERGVRAISQADFARSSRAPAWGALDGSLAAASGVRLRPWRAALAEYLAAGPG